MTITKEKLKNDNYLCTLDTGREVFKGDKLYRISLDQYSEADSVFTDSDRDTYLCFKPIGNAWIDGPLRKTGRTQMVR